MKEISDILHKWFVTIVTNVVTPNVVHVYWLENKHIRKFPWKIWILVGNMPSISHFPLQTAQASDIVGICWPVERICLYSKWMLYTINDTLFSFISATGKGSWWSGKVASFCNEMIFGCIWLLISFPWSAHCTGWPVQSSPTFHIICAERGLCKCRISLVAHIG